METKTSLKARAGGHVQLNTLYEKYICKAALKTLKITKTFYDWIKLTLILKNKYKCFYTPTVELQWERERVLSKNPSHTQIHRPEVWRNAGKRGWKVPGPGESDQGLFEAKCYWSEDGNTDVFGFCQWNQGLEPTTEVF